MVQHDRPLDVISLDHFDSKFVRLYGMLRAAIAGGGLPAGARLPSSRELAARNDVSRGTVVAVFDQLRADGFIEARHGAGTFVRRAVGDAAARAVARVATAQPRTRTPFPRAIRQRPAVPRQPADVSLFRAGRGRG